MLNLFSFKTLAVLIVAVSAVAAIGNAAALTISDGTNQTILQGGSDSFTTDAADVAYTVEDNGDVTVTATFTDSYDAVEFQYDSAGNFEPCSGGPSAWTCTIPAASVEGSDYVEFIAVSDDTTQ